MSSRSCLKKPDSFGYICAEVALKTQRNALSTLEKTAYELYFGFKVDDQDQIGQILLPQLLKNLDRVAKGYSQIYAIYTANNMAGTS